MKTLTHIIAFCVFSMIAGCGGGGVGSLPAEPQEAPPPSLRPPPPCIDTTDFGCVSLDRYREERETIELEHNGEDDFDNQWGLTAIRADRAYAQLELKHGAGTEPGAGQTVGLIDTGIDTGHPMFVGKTVDEDFFSSASNETGDIISHGTAVASVIVGDPSAAVTFRVTAPRGVARGADVAMFALPTGSGSRGYVPISLMDMNSIDGTWGP